MVQQQQKVPQSGEGRLVEVQKHSENQNEEKIPAEYILEFISRHHLNRLWEEFVYEKNHPKIPLSAVEVLAMVNLSPEEQQKILEDHE